MAKILQVNDEQLDAIISRDCSILVSAPAGSGKTKILVSRILSLLQDDFYHIDELLVLTFTNAAALEMKQRLQAELVKTLQQDLDDKTRKHLSLQNKKIETAYITNFHGFCSTLLKQYGDAISINPSFNIASDTALIQDQILDLCISNWATDLTFVDFYNKYFGEYNYASIKSMIIKLYTVKTTTYNFDDYIDTMFTSIYQPIIEDNDMKSWAPYKQLEKIFQQDIIDMKNRIYTLYNFCSKNGISDFYANPKPENNKPTPMDTLLMYVSEVTNRINNTGIHSLVSGEEIKIQTTYRMSWDEQTKPYSKEFSSLKSAINKTFKKHIEDLLYPSSKYFIEAMSLSKDAIKYLLTLMTDFEQEYILYKESNNIIDFNDLEKYTLKLLEPRYGVVSTLSSQLKEIMVDEYQDTNQIQETLVQKIATHSIPSTPCFMVGDMKQSIYRFRKADPAIFKEKYDAFVDNDISTKRIDLLFNYRSNKIVLDSINYIFNQIMDHSIGGLEYYFDDSAKLNYDYLRKEGASDTSQKSEVTKVTNIRLNNEKRFTTEILLVDKQDQSTASMNELEAKMVARRIHELMESMKIDSYNGKTRKPKFKDIAVLMRGASEFVTFKKIFDKYNIPCNIVLNKGFLQSPEIIDSISLLQAVDNHLDDIAFTSLLTGSYLVSNFDENFIAKIANYQQSSMYQNLIEYSKEHDDLKVNEFIDYYHQLVDYSYKHSSYELLYKFYSDNQYPSFIVNLYNGKQRLSNINLLLDLLKDYNDTSLFDVVSDFTKKIQKSYDMSPAPLLSTNEDAVTFMTIHKSKGLEFPIVFVSQIHKRFNLMDSTNRFISDKDLGITINPRKSYTSNTVGDVVLEYDNKYRRLIANVQTAETINEEIRIFYVALTRASQKLICTGISKGLEELVSMQEKALNQYDERIIKPHDSTVLFYDDVRKYQSYKDYILLSLVRHPDFILQCKNRDFMQDDESTKDTLYQNALSLQLYNQELVKDVNTMHSKFSYKLFLPEEIESYEVDTIIPKKINAVLDTYVNYAYPHENNLEKSSAVTKKIEDGDRHFVNYDEDVDRSIQANIRGTIIHKVLELLPLKKDINPLLELEKITESNYFNDDEVTVIRKYIPKLVGFVDSDVYQFMLDSKAVYFEKKFSFIDDNKQIIHGIFDVLVINDESIDIIDYKTDTISDDNDEKTLIALHQSQMDYYKKVLKKIYPNKKIQATVYYLHINKSVTF